MEEERVSIEKEVVKVVVEVTVGGTEFVEEISGV